jgi:hypothetical protein
MNTKTQNARRPQGGKTEAGKSETQSPMRQHRTWDISTKAGNLEQQLKSAGLNTSLKAIAEILDRCEADSKLSVTAFKITRPTTTWEAKAHLQRKGFTTCCACEFSSWAIEHGNDVDQETTWITEAVQRTASNAPLAITLAFQTVYAIPMPEKLETGMMLLAIKADNAKHRVANRK